MRSSRRPAELLVLLAVAACASPGPKPRPASVATTTPGVKIGKPYQVYGVWYYPADDRAYDQHGIASWYGPGFHALSTANGERYDQDDVTAAHKTLPMPSYVEVANLDNGRKLTVRINDRGPFVAGRIIDLSRRSAQLLGVDRAGTAKVRVRRVYPDAETMRRLAPPPAAMPLPPIVIAAATVAPGEAVVDEAPPAVTTVGIPGAAIPGAAPIAAIPGAAPIAAIPGAAPIAASGGRFVQVAALSDAGRIAWLSGYLAAFGPVVTERTPAGLTRLRLGPYYDGVTANGVLAKVRAAGYSDARLIIPASVQSPKP